MCCLEKDEVPVWHTCASKSRRGARWRGLSLKSGHDRDYNVNQEATNMTRIALVMILLLAAGCDQNTSDSPRQGQSATRTAPHTVPTPPAGAAMAWVAPEGWVEEVPSNAMRKAQFVLPSPFNDGTEATVVLFNFGGGGGAVQANLDRWYSQFKQPDGGNTKDRAKVVNADYNGFKHTLVDVTGIFLYQETLMGPVTEERPNHRLLADVIETASGPWFIKLTGPEAVVDYYHASFYDFASSFGPDEHAGHDH